MTDLKYIILGSLLLAACAQPAIQPQGQNPVEPAAENPAEPAEENPEEPAAENPVEQSMPQAESKEKLPNVDLTSDMLYEYLVSEIASQRGNVGVAAEASLDLARKTRDPRIAMRAAQLALQSGQTDKAIEAIKVWREIDPESPMATRTLSAVLLRSGMLDEARQELTKMLQAKDVNAGQVFFQTYQMLAPYSDKAAALKFMRDLAQPYPGVAEAHWGVAQLALASGDDELAVNEAKQAYSLRPDWDMAVSLEAHLLEDNAPKQGLEVLRAFLSKHPEASEIRLQYARALLEEKQYKQSRDEFRKLAEEAPDNPELAFAIALISLQLNDLQGAETQLKQALIKGKKDQDTVQYYLGQLSEAKKNDDEALERYRQVTGGEHQFAAQLRIVYLLNKRGQLAEARLQLHLMQAADNAQRVQLVLIEAQLLRAANQHAEAYRLLRENLEKLPNHPDLLYETGMEADMNGERGVFEQMMRKLIRIKPDYAHAYNALGYSLLDRNERIPEAMEMVKKALQLAPNDAAIMDSVGWGFYRTGDLDESIKMLRRAYAVNPDPEIAAHLGEVLWQHGDKEEAKKIWQESLKANQGNAPLQAVMKRFMP